MNHRARLRGGAGRLSIVVGLAVAFAGATGSSVVALDTGASAVTPCAATTAIQLSSEIGSSSTCTVVDLAQGTYVGGFSAQHSVSIVGTSQSTTILSGGGTELVLTVGEGHVVSLTNLTIKSGLGSPTGGIYNDGGTLTLNHVNVSDNKFSTVDPPDAAGGVVNFGTMTITNQSSVTANNGSNQSLCVGGISNEGTLTISANSIVSQNTCSGVQGTGGIYSTDILDIFQSTVTYNSATGQTALGGGIYATGTLVISGGTVTQNTAGNSNSVSACLCIVESGESTGGTGGGVDIADGTATVVSSLIAGNQAEGFVLLTGVKSGISELPFLAAGDGGGVFVGPGGTLNMSGAGGVDNNSASACGGGIFVSGAGGGTLNGTTIQGNVAGETGGGIYERGVPSFSVDSNVNIGGNSPNQTSTGTEYGECGVASG